MTTYKFRENDTISTILDVYEKAFEELKASISDLSPQQLSEVVDHETTNKDCESVQSILSHVVQSAYTYVLEIRRWKEEDGKKKMSNSEM